MRPYPIVFCLAFFFCLLCFPCVELLANPLPAIYDGDFSNWSYTVLLQSGAGAGSMTRETTGGNPGAFLSVSTQSGWDLAMWVVMWNDDITWDPGTDGVIDSLQLMIEEKEISSFGDGQNLKLALIQDGNTYLAPVSPWATGGGTGTSWEHLMFDPVTPDDFARIPPWPYDPNARPDFSSTGGPIHFGFMVGVSSVLDPRVHGYDNYEVVIFIPVVGIDPDASVSTWSQIKTLYR